MSYFGNEMKYMTVKIKTSRLNTNIDGAEEQPRGSKIKLRNTLISTVQMGREMTHEIKGQRHG